MIDLFSSDTPNGKKISIMLEEIGFEYAVKKMDLSNSSFSYLGEFFYSNEKGVNWFNTNSIRSVTCNYYRNFSSVNWVSVY